MTDAPPSPQQRWTAAWRGLPQAFWLAAAIAVSLALLLVAALHQADTEHKPEASARLVERQPPPPVEPLVFAPIAADKARAANDAIAFAKDRGPPARRFTFAGALESRERAIDCLASAMWYEAGGDARGQKAVAQVVLNRVRHPAFPGTVCGVVFQGSERSTGCQFTFTCDGALRRVPSVEAFALTRARARAMLEGQVQSEVGLATHYHTDWVHPIWSAQLEKIAQVDTHLFFRWSGVWGTLAAQRKPYHGGEPSVASLAFLSPFHRSGPLVDPSEAADALAAGRPPPLPGPVDLGNGRFRIFMSSARNGNVQAAVALELCGTRDYCKLTGMLDQPGLLGRAPVVFVYVRNRAHGFERAMWDCEVFKRPAPAQCFGQLRDVPDLPLRNPQADPAPPPRAVPSASATTPARP